MAAGNHAGTHGPQQNVEHRHKSAGMKCNGYKVIRQHRTIPALRLKHRSGSCGTASALPKCSIMSGCGTRIVLRGQKPLALCDRCPCFGSLFPPLAALTFAASSIICAFGLASAAPRSPYRHLELCGIAFIILYNFTLYPLLRRDARCFSPTVDCCHARHGANSAWFALIFYCVYIIIKLFYCLIFRATPHNSRLAA